MTCLENVFGSWLAVGWRSIKPCQPKFPQLLSLRPVFPISGIGLVVVFLAAVVILIVLMLMVGQRPPRVKTNCGFVQGEFDAKINAFIFKVLFDQLFSIL